MTVIELTEKSNPASSEIDLLSPLEIARIINREDQKVAYAVEKVLDSVAQGIDLIAKAFAQGGRLAYFGAGTSGRLGILDASEMPPTFGVGKNMVQAFIAGGEDAVRNAVENAEDNEEFALADLTKFCPQPQDVIVGISAGGNPAYVATALRQARALGLKAIAISSTPQAEIAQYADVFINPQVGPEVITGSSRMKSGTAQKMILNMLTTGAMIRLGKTYKNYMIDLQVSNAKLHKRACRFVSEIAGTTPEQAATFLQKSDNSVKTACVMAAKNCSKDEAEKLLAGNGGILRKIIKG